MKAVLHAIEVIVIGIVVTITGASIEALANYHPTGEAAAFWSVFGLVIIGALKGAYSWLLTRQAGLGKDGQVSQSFLFLIIAFALAIGGCSLINKGLDIAAPDQINAETNAAIPGTRTATPITNSAAGMIPYGSYVLNFLLLAANLIQKVEADKLAAKAKLEAAAKAIA